MYIGQLFHVTLSNNETHLMEFLGQDAHSFTFRQGVLKIDMTLLIGTFKLDEYVTVSDMVMYAYEKEGFLIMNNLNKNSAYRLEVFGYKGIFDLIDPLHYVERMGVKVSNVRWSARTGIVAFTTNH